MQNTNILVQDLHTRLYEYDVAREQSVAEGEERQAVWYAAKIDLLNILIADYS